MEKIDILCAIHTNHINTQCGQDDLWLSGSYGGIYSNHLYLELYTAIGCDATLLQLRTPSFRRCYSVSSVSMRRAVSGGRIVLKFVLEI